MDKETNSVQRLSYNKDASSFKPEDNDAALVVLVRQGNLDAFEQLIEKHQKRMLNIAYRLIGDYDEACEGVQDAFVSAYKSIGSFRGQAKFSTWLTTITLNHARNRLKQIRTRQRHIAYSLDEPIQTDNGELAREPRSNEPSAVERLEKRDVRMGVRRCIEELEQAFREVIILRDMQDFSYDEISAALKIGEGTVKSRLFRARDAVRNCLKKSIGDL